MTRLADTITVTTAPDAGRYVVRRIRPSSPADERWCRLPIPSTPAPPCAWHTAETYPGGRRAWRASSLWSEETALALAQPLLRLARAEQPGRRPAPPATDDAALVHRVARANGLALQEIAAVLGRPASALSRLNEPAGPGSRASRHPLTEEDRVTLGAMLGGR